MGTNARPRKRRKTTQSFRALLTLVIAFVVAFAVPTTVAIASEDGSDSSPGTSQTATTDDSTTSTTTSTPTPTTTADPPDSSADDQSEGSGGDDADAAPGDQSGDSTAGDEETGEDSQDATDPGQDSAASDSEQDDSPGSQPADSTNSDQSSDDDQSEDDTAADTTSDETTTTVTDTTSSAAETTTSTTQTTESTVSIDPVPTIALSQGSGCVSTVLTLGGDVPSDFVAYLSIRYGDPGAPFTAVSTVIGPGASAGDYPLSVDANSLPSEAYDFGYPVRGVVSYFYGSVADGTEVVLDTSCRTPTQPADTDNDGVPDDQDQCPNTPAGTTVDEHGCPVVLPPADSDGDGVSDDKDKCADTPAGATVDADGCADSQKDSDGDGVTNDKDKCPGTAPGFTVDVNGCIVCPPGTQPIHAEGDDIVNDCRPVVTTPPSTPTTTSSSPTSTAQPTGSSNPPTDSSGPTASPQPTGTSGGPTTQQPTGNPGPTIIDVPAAPTINDPSGPGNATWIVPVDSDPRITWTLSDGDRWLVASVTGDVFFTGGSQEYVYGLACDSEGEQAAPVASNAGNPTPQPTGNGGEGVRASTSGAENVRAIGLICLLVLAGGVMTVVVRRRRTGEHM